MQDIRASLIGLVLFLVQPALAFDAAASAASLVRRPLRGRRAWTSLSRQQGVRRRDGEVPAARDSGALSCSEAEFARGAEALRRHAFRLAGPSLDAGGRVRAGPDPPAYRRALDALDPRRADCPALFVAAAAVQTLCRARGSIPRALLLGLVFRHAWPCGERPARSPSRHGDEFRRSHRHIWPRAERNAHLLSQPFASAVLFQDDRAPVSVGSCRRLRPLSARN